MALLLWRALRLLPLLLLPAAALPQSDHRVIVHFAEEAGGKGTALLDHRVRELGAKPGVLQVKALPHVGLAVAHCASLEDEERLIRELDEDPTVELATPDTWVYLADGDKRRPGERPLQDLRQCKAQSGCAALKLAGNCCPANDGLMLACCDGPTTQNLVSFKGYHGKYMVAEEDGSCDCNWETTGDWEKFQLFYNDDGSVSLKSFFGKYVSADANGEVTANKELIGSTERFELVRNSDKTVSLKTKFGKYFVAEPDGTLHANREESSSWEHFQMSIEGSNSQRFPNDANFSALWGMHHRSDKDIDALEAWKIFTGEFSSGIVVAVVDTGIDYTHEDLRENMWWNPGEIPGNGIDDDGNGIVDDVHGADFANEDGDPFDDQMHGTHCAGTIAGVGNNGVGVSGVAWRGVRLMALKFLGSTGSGRTSDAVRAIDYAVAHGAKIASNSWGGGGSSAALRVAIERASQAGMLFIAAAGNSGSNNDETPNFPSNYPSDNVIAVASTTYKGELSSFSSFGATTVDVAAPGSSIYSTIPDQGYKSLSGTSMATPHVSGLAALVWMYRPALEMTQVKDIILSSVEDLSSLHGKVASGGRISARKALKAASALEPPQPPVHAPSGLTFQDVDTRVGVLKGTVTIMAAADETDVEYYKVYFVSTAGFQLDAVGNVTATGAKLLEVNTDGPLVLPKFAGGLVAVTGNASGEMAAQLGGAAPNTTVEDYGLPELGPQAVTWGGDTNMAAGAITGTLKVTRAHDESTISHYNIYWSNPVGPHGPLLGSIPAIGFRTPNCTGRSCGDILRSGSAESHRYERRDYADDEEATIVTSGPGSVVVSRFDTEDYYDTLAVGATTLSGKPDVPLEVELPRGPVSIVWRSDHSITSSGWAFELVQTAVHAPFELKDVRPIRQGLMVVPAFGRMELTPQAIYVEVTDHHEKSSPSAALIPKAVRFHPHAQGPLAGVAEIEPADGAAADGAVGFYFVDFADADGKVLGEGQRVGTNGTAAVLVKIPRGQLPAGAVQIRVRAGNAAGLTTSHAAAALAGAPAPPPRPRRLAPSTDDSEPWLRPPQHAHSERRVVWQAAAPAKGAVGAAGVGIQAAAPSAGSHVICTLTLPGLDASAVGPELRKALSRAFAAGLPHVEDSDVEVARVMAASGTGGGKRWPPRPKGASAAVAEQKDRTAVVEFRVQAPAGARAGFLDRVESRLILLGQGGAWSGHFSEGFLTALGKAGAQLPPGTRIQRVDVGEPQQVGELVEEDGTPDPSLEQDEGAEVGPVFLLALFALFLLAGARWATPSPPRRWPAEWVPADLVAQVEELVERADESDGVAKGASLAAAAFLSEDESDRPASGTAKLPDPALSQDKWTLGRGRTARTLV